MKKFIRKISCLLLTIVLFVTAGSPAYASPEAALADVSLTLLREALQKSDTDQNVLISPDSIFTALAMVENGAAGSTLSEMKAVLGGLSVGELTAFLTDLHKRLSSSTVFTYRPANSIWYKKGSIKLKKAFKAKMAEQFQATVKGAAFDGGTVKKINDWVNKSTNGKIPSIIRQLSPQARVFLINAVYFQARWTEPFGIEHKRKFTKESGAKQKVTMLESVEDVYVEICGATGFVKNYAGWKTAFMALLPPKGMRVLDYLGQVTGEEFVQGYRKRIETGVDVFTRLPAFTYDYDISLKDVLMRMGIQSAFLASANFKRMATTSLCIDDVIHKTHIKLTKDGTEAAAVTAIPMNATSIAPLPTVQKKVYLNRPFVIAILDTQTGFPLFLGVIKGVKE